MNKQFVIFKITLAYYLCFSWEIVQRSAGWGTWLRAVPC